VRLDDGSRMSREVHVRFWESRGVRFPPATHLAIAEREGVELHIVVPQPEDLGPARAYLHVRNIDALHAAWSDAGLPVSELCDEPWGMREFSLMDPGGNRLRVGTSI